MMSCLLCRLSQTVGMTLLSYSNGGRLVVEVAWPPCAVVLVWWALFKMDDWVFGKGAVGSTCAPWRALMVRTFILGSFRGLRLVRGSEIAAALGAASELGMEEGPSCGEKGEMCMVIAHNRAIHFLWRDFYIRNDWIIGVHSSNLGISIILNCLARGHRCPYISGQQLHKMLLSSGS